MTFLPVVERELRVLSRKPMSIWTRVVFGGIAIALWLLVLQANRHSDTSTVSKQLFIAVSVIGLIFALISGVFLTADCLSSERRDGTLGLLFLTDLKGYDVILGKLGATSLQATYGLLAIIPVLGLPLLMGGVSVGQFYRVSLVLLVTLGFSLGTGMLCSALNRQSRQAMSVTLLVVLALTGVLPALGWLDTFFTSESRFPQLFWLSPVHAYIKALDTFYIGSGKTEFLVTTTLIAAIALCALIASAIILPKVWRDEEVAGPDPAPKPSLGGVRRMQWMKEASLRTHNPYEWLASRDNSCRRFGWRIAGLLTLVWGGGYLAALFSHRHEEGFIICFFAAYALHQAIKWIAALEITRQLHTDKQSGGLELLMVTPIQEQHIFAGQRVAYRRKLRGLLWLGTMASLLMLGMVMAGPESLHFGLRDQGYFGEAFIGGLVLLWLDLRVLEDVGMFMALQATKHHRAVLASIGKVMLLPWAAIFFLFFAGKGLRISSEDVPIMLGAWIALGVAVDVILLGINRERLKIRDAQSVRFANLPTTFSDEVLHPEPANVV